MKPIICIICPNSCEITIEGEAVLGAKCKRGIQFAQQEIQEPRRTITTTIRIKNQQIPVKSKQRLPLHDIPLIMSLIKQTTFKELPTFEQELTIEGYQEPISLIVTGEGI